MKIRLILLFLFLISAVLEANAWQNSYTYKNINIATYVSTYDFEKVTRWGDITPGELDGKPWGDFGVNLKIRKEGAYLYFIESIEQKNFCYDGRIRTYITSMRINDKPHAFVNHYTKNGDSFAIKQSYLVPSQTKPEDLAQVAWFDDTIDENGIPKSEEYLKREVLYTEPTEVKGEGRLSGNNRAKTTNIGKYYAPDINIRDIKLGRGWSLLKTWGSLDTSTGQRIPEQELREKFINCGLIVSERIKNKFHRLYLFSPQGFWKSPSLQKKAAWKSVFIADDLEGARKLAMKENKPLFVFLYQMGIYGQTPISRIKNQELLDTISEYFIPVVYDYEDLDSNTIRNLDVFSTPHFIIVNNAGILTSQPANITDERFLDEINRLLVEMRKIDQLKW